MKLLSVLLILILSFSGISAMAEIGYPPYDYLVSKGYTLERLDDSPGWRTCNLMGGDGWWGLSFSDETDGWMLMALPMFNPTFELSEFEALFVEMVEKFDWDVSFYWPDYDSGSNIALSYNIVKDIDQTDKNYLDKAEYISALKKRFGISDSFSVESIPISSELSPKWLASEYTANLSNDAFIARASYIEDAALFTLTIQSADISTLTWNAAASSVRLQYKDILSDIVTSTKESLIEMGFGNVAVVATFQLSDGAAAYMMVDNNDLSFMVSG